MKKTTKSILWGIVVIIVIVLIVVSTKTKEPAPLTGESVKIGVVAGFTGAASTWADMSKKGIDLAVKEANANGGLNGKRIEVVYEDSETNPTKGVSAFNKLVLVDDVSVVFGDVWSFLTNPLIPLADQEKIVLISPTVMDVSVEGSSPYFYTMGHTIDSQRKAAEAFFDANKDVKTMSVLYWNDMWGTANKDLLLEVAAEKGVQIVSTETTNDFGATYQSEITKIKAANPDAIYFNSSLPDVVLRKIKDLGLNDTKILTLSPAVDAIEVTKTPVSYLKNVYFINWVPDAAFTKKFNEEYGMYPIIETQNSYDMTNAVIAALKESNDVAVGLKSVKFKGVEGYSIDFTGTDQIRVNGGVADLYTYDGAYNKVN